MWTVAQQERAHAFGTGKGQSWRAVGSQHPADDCVCNHLKSFAAGQPGQR